MKKILLIIGLFFTSITLFSQTEFTNIFDNVYKNVKFDTVSSGILHNRVIFSLANLKNYNDVPDTTNAKHFIQAYYELQNATVTKDKIFDRSIDELYLPMNIPNDSNINIGIIYSDYHIIDTNAFYNGKLLIIDSSIYINDTNSNPLFTKKTLFLSSPLINYTHNLSLNFSINSDYYFKNTEISINKLLINFGDGLSFREFIIDSNFNIIQNIIYSNYGEKIITLKGITEYGDTLTSFAKIFVRAKADLVEKERKADFYIVSDISYKGNGETTAIKGEAEMRVYYSDETVESKQIKRPILIVDGFDPGDKRQFEEDIVDNPADDKGGIWGLLKYEYNEDTIYLGDTLLKKGYDIIILNFPLIKVSNQHNSSFDPNGYYYRDGGSDFIERNALACIKAIDTINYFLKEFGSKEQLVIIGPSMGGQITRYALNYMEDSLPSRDYREHNTRLWVSFDSPHQGANIPLGAQAAVKYFGNISSDAYLKYDNILRSTAARQMLLLHLETYNKDNYSCSHDPLYSLYYNKVYDMGFPSKLRKVAISNGSLKDIRTGYAEKPVLSASINNLFLLGLSIAFKDPIYTLLSDLRICDIKMAPQYGAGPKVVFKGLWIMPNHEVQQSSSTNHCSYDVTHGGTLDTYKDIRDIMKKYSLFIYSSLDQPSHCFMPTKSTLAYKNGRPDLCEDLSDRDLVAGQYTIFDNYWGSIGSNMAHVTFNKSLHEWFNKELDTYIKGERELTICGTYQYTINSFNVDSTLQWECSDNLQIISDPRNHTLSIKPLQPGNGWIRAINSPDYRQDTLAYYQIYVGSTDFITSTETTESTTWNTDLNIGSDFTIKTGHTLTIQNARISIAYDVKIKIEAGAKLIIDNSTLTNYCGSNYWGGIEVFGQKNQPQIEQNQGTLIVKNNSIIENSRNAISTWRTNDWNSMGGIVKAENSTFRNNIRSAEFLSYKNTNSNSEEISNVSRFTNCTFIWDRSMFPHDKTSLSHVTLLDVMGVMFIGCDFTDNQILNNSIIKHGILAEDAGFKVLAKITPSSQGFILDKSQFSSLNYGIRVSNTEKSVEVMDSYFDDNFCGIFATSANNLTITTNELKLKPVLNIRELYPTELAYGVVIDNSIGYKIEQNNFFGEEENLKGTGLQIKNSGKVANEIRNNIFRNLLYSTNAIGRNRRDYDVSVGLKYICNDFKDTKYGISVINNSNDTWSGIDIYQNGGNITQPAENIFDNKENPLFSDIYIADDSRPIFYTCFLDGSNKDPLSISSNIIKNGAGNGVASETDCTRDYGILDDLELHNHHTFIENEYLTLLYNYNNLLDGGSKDELLDKLLDSWEGDVWDLRQAYLDASPYLSPDVLKELALSEKLPLAVYLEVALSNPEGTQKDEYIDFMKSTEGENLLTPTGIELIKGSWDTKTFRATLESNISSKLSDMEEVSRTIIYRIINDSTGVNISNYRDRLNSIRNIEAKYELVDSYIGTKEYNTAETLLNTLLTDPNNEKYNANDINDYLLLLSIMRDKNDTTNLIPIDERLETLSNSSTRAGAKAKAYLYFNNQETDYHPDYVDLELNEKSKVIRRVTSSLDKLFAANVKISPNPAKDHIILTYNLPPRQIYTIKIYDNKGIELLTNTLKNNKGVQTIELKNFKSGAYYYTITDSKSVIKSDKIIIVK